MQHLFLTSSIGVPGVGESIRRRLGTDKVCKTAFITTPIEGEADQSDLSWVQEDHNGLNKSGFATFDYTITGKTRAEIARDLKDIDALYISGGDEFYLREQCNVSDFDDFVHTFVSQGGLYIGTSAGSIIAGHDMSAIAKLSPHPHLKNPLDHRGFGLVNYTILPHWGSQDFATGWLSPESFECMYASPVPLIPLNNYQYIEVVGDDSTIVDVRITK